MNNVEVDTGIEVRVYRGEGFLGISAEMSTGRWETHFAPIESSPWTYHADVDEAVKCLVRYGDRYGSYKSHNTDDSHAEYDDKYLDGLQ